MNVYCRSFQLILLRRVKRIVSRDKYIPRLRNYLHLPIGAHRKTSTNLPVPTDSNLIV